ncbi:MAG TPA: histidine phosphatase family protein [Candidatus Eisenbacteria bacterium]|nr:histidine phosphatase family protein [Candidatus Eisenbacteria bacterium]
MSQGAATEIWLVRHGETQWSTAGRHTGCTDVPLTEGGREQARALRGILGGRRFALVLTSPLARARETCELAGYGGVCQPLDDLREWDYGDYEGRTTASIREERPGWTVWSGGVPHGESVEQVGARAARVLERVEQAPGDVALFSHAHFLRILAAVWLGLPPVDGRLLRLDTASVSRLGWERETHVLLTWNEDWNRVREALTASGP